MTITWPQLVLGIWLVLIFATQIARRVEMIVGLHGKMAAIEQRSEDRMAANSGASVGARVLMVVLARAIYATGVVYVLHRGGFW